LYHIATMSSSMAKASAGSDGSSLRPAKSAQETTAWLQRVHEAQSSRLPPERREELWQKAESSRLRVQQARKCKAIGKSAHRSHMLVHEGLRQMACSAGGSSHAEVAERWRSAQSASEARQHRKMAAVEASRSARMEAEVDSSSDEDDQEAVQEMAQLMQSADASVLAAPPAATAGRPGGRDEGLEALLAQVRREPTDAEECMAKFAMYEGYSAQLEKIRKALFDYYEETSPTVPVSVSGEWQRQLQRVDSAEAMGVPDDDGRIWFVYHMLKAADRNNGSMTAVLADFQRKIELLAQNDQTECPVCLEDFTAPGSPHAPETLSCCHKICEECWDNWKQVTHGRPFCPLCKNEEFLDVVARNATHGHDL